MAMRHGAEQAELLPPEHPDPECPGFDVCPVAMCGCRWINQGSPWVESAQAEPDTGTG